MKKYNKFLAIMFTLNLMLINIIGFNEGIKNRGLENIPDVKI